MTKEEKTPETSTKSDRRFSDLRQRAEARLGQKTADFAAQLGVEDQQQLIQELAVYHTELEMQNEALKESQQEAEAAREQYQALYDLAPIGYFDLDQQGHIRQVNRAGAELLGLDQTGLAGQPFNRFFPRGLEQSQIAWQAHFNRLLETGTGQPIELEMVRANGSLFWAQLRSALQPGAGRAAPQVLTTVVDVTDRKQAEAARRELNEILEARVEARTRALRQSERRFKMAVQAIGGGVYEHRIPFDETLYHSPRWAEILGYRPAELPQFDQFEAWLYRQIHPDDVEGFQSAYLAFIEGKQPGFEVETRLRHKQGHWVWVREYSHALERDKNGRVTRLVGLMHDITDRKRTEEALRESETLYRTLAANLPGGGVFLLDRDLRYIVAEGQALATAEYTSASFEGKSIWEALDGPTAKAYEPLFRQALAGQPFSYEHQSHGRYYMSEGVPIRDVNGVVTHLLALSYDITERKRSEQALQALTEHLEARVAKRTAVLETQSEQLRALSARLADVQENERRALARELHDRVGQNLSGLDFSLHALRARLEAGDPDQAPLLATVDQARLLVEQTSSQVRNVLADLRPPVLDDFGLVDTLHWYADHQAELWGLEITVVGESLAPRLPAATEIALFRIVQEALTNVAKHAQAGRVIISVEPEPERVRLTVVDNGRGFEPVKGKQASWGLRVMQERAEMVGGECHIESIPDDGARVVVEVPRAAGQVSGD
jgi:PAS domain S-box-containing protein